jgi:endonuclease/exonuclease/phosphatase family metal-dependent hydrolase
VLLALSILSFPTIASAQLPPDWSSQDIGSVGVSGRASSGGGYFYVNGGGADIWGTADGFHFAYRTLTGDGEIYARVNSVDYVNAWAKAGVMMRDSLSAGAKHAFMLVSAGKGTAFQRRPWSDGESLSSGAGGGPGYFVRITRTGNNFDGYISTDGANWSWVASEWIDMPSTIYVGFGVTAHAYGALGGGVFSDAMVRGWGDGGGSSSGGGSGSSGGGGGGSVQPATTLPGGWASGDIGDVAAAGWATGSGSELAIGGSGADIWGSSDEFRFAYRTLTGDGSIVARVNTVDYYDAWSKGGVMMRESLSPGSAHAFMLASAGKGLGFQRRTSAGGGSTHTGAGGGPGYYVKLVRTGNTFNAYASPDGSNWSFVGGDYILMGSTIYVGVAVTSHADGAVAGAGFSGVEVVEGGIEAVAPPPAEAPAPPPPPPPATGSSLRVLHWNTQHLRGADGSYNPGRTAAWIAAAQPDIVSLNEIDDEWMAGEITSALIAATGVHWNATFSGWGNLILTKLPIHGTSICGFNPGARRVAAHMSTVFNGRAINLYSAHLATDSTSTRMYEVYNLQDCANNVGEARLMAGDFNMQPYSPEYNVAVSAYSDTWLTASSRGTAYNYPGNCDGCTRNSRIDYIFQSYGAWFMSVESAQVIDTRDGWGTMASDHKPLLVVFSVQ